MKKHHEHLLVASLAGLIIAGAAAFAVQPADAARFPSNAQAEGTSVAGANGLHLHTWSASRR